MSAFGFIESSWADSRKPIARLVTLRTAQRLGYDGGPLVPALFAFELTHNGVTVRLGVLIHASQQIASSEARSMMPMLDQVNMA